MIILLKWSVILYIPKILIINLAREYVNSRWINVTYIFSIRLFAGKV